MSGLLHDVALMLTGKCGRGRKTSPQRVPTELLSGKVSMPNGSLHDQSP
jgi:hypothetical protein